MATISHLRDRRPPDAAPGVGRARRRWPSLALLLALLLVLWLAAGTAWAQGQPVAEAVLQRGVLKLRRAGVEEFHRQPGRPIPLLETDVLQTGENTRATITLLDTGESMQMYSNSHMALATIRRDLTSIDLNVGKALFAFFRDVLGGREVEVTTETMVVGVKGTEFIVGAAGEESYVLTLDGAVGVRPAAEPDREVRVERDEFYYVTREVAPAAAETVSPETRERIRTEEGLEGFREEAGLAQRPEEAEPEPLGISTHVGLAGHSLNLPFTGGSESFERTIDSSGVLLAVEWRFLGPLSIGAMGFEGEVTDSSTPAGDPLDATEDEGGRTSMTALLLGMRSSGTSWDWALHGGWFRSHTRLPEGSLGLGERTVSLEGPLVRGLLDYVTEAGVTFGVALYVGWGDPSGSEIDRLEAVGAEFDPATLTMLSLNAGLTF